MFRQSWTTTQRVCVISRAAIAAPAQQQRLPVNCAASEMWHLWRLWHGGLVVMGCGVSAQDASLGDGRLKRPVINLEAGENICYSETTRPIVIFIFGELTILWMGSLRFHFNRCNRCNTRRSVLNWHAARVRTDDLQCWLSPYFMTSLPELAAAFERHTSYRTYVRACVRPF